MSDKKISRLAYKRLKGGMYAPEDLTWAEFKALQTYYPQLGVTIQRFLERRQKMIEDGEWTKDHEPPWTPHRVRRYERGESLVDPWHPDK